MRVWASLLAVASFGLSRLKISWLICGLLSLVLWFWSRDGLDRKWHLIFIGTVAPLPALQVCIEGVISPL
jgi:hypothetical protein